ncbi:nucleolar complex protein 14, partial [Teratosphaeriaceae sp. CCFEE 6253]
KTKDDDDDLREKLDKGMADLLPLLRAQPPPPPSKSTTDAGGAMANGDANKINPERQKLLDGMDRKQADRAYETRLRELARDSRAKPSERSKTAEERAKDLLEQSKALEERRMKRMRGEAVSDDEDAEMEVEEDVEMDAGVGNVSGFRDEGVGDEAADFGFAAAVAQAEVSEGGVKAKVQHEDEDEFDFDADLVASDPDVDSELSDDDEPVEAEGSSDGEDSETGNAARARAPRVEQEEDDEFVRGILGGANAIPVADPSARHKTLNINTGLPTSSPCPRTHPELLALLADSPVAELPTTIQRLRATYHPALAAANKGLLAEFSVVLVKHLVHMAELDQPLTVMEQVIRHLHSLSRTYGVEITGAMRARLKARDERGGAGVGKGDLVVLVAIGAIYPTSDHFHRVVTPAMTLVGRWLALNAPASAKAVKGAGGVMRKGISEVGAFVVALCVRWQARSRRVVPEAVRFTVRALGCLQALGTDGGREAHVKNLVGMAECWQDCTAFPELFAPFLPLLQKSGVASELAQLQQLLHQAHQKRRPLELHHHRPQSIRTSIPKFEEGFNPDKHYDPDRERSEARKLRQEVRREKKGAVRELRRDGAFVAREGLREKRERDEAFVRRERRVLAEIGAGN